MTNKFIYEHNGERIEMVLEGHISTDDMLEAFTRFMLAQGFELPEQFAKLEFATDWKT
jgi:hypothetical protein